MKNSFLIIIILVLLGIDSTYANIRPSSSELIYSKIQDEEREILIQLPLHYEINKELNYPVLYLLDGPDNINHTSGTLDFLAGNDNAPELIIVAIKNTNRSRDLTPTVDKEVSYPNGGGEKFLDFIEQELIPYINTNYRTENYKIIAKYLIYLVPNILKL